jgi:glycosyltransferase involved in cell wall biosynthesis
MGDLSERSMIVGDTRNTIKTPDTAQAVDDRLAHPAVTMLCFYYYPNAGGGADRLMQRVAELLAGRSWHMAVLTQTVPGTPKDERVNGVRVRRLFLLSLPGLRFFSYMLAAFWYQLTRRDAGQVLHLNQLYLHVPVALWLRRLRGLRVVVRVACGGPHGEIARLRGLPLGIGRWVLRAARRADAVISLTDQITEELLGAGFARQRILQAPNGVDAARFAPVSSKQRAALRKQLGLPLEQPIVFFAGRFEAQKAVDVLLRAWQQVQAQHPAARLVLAGDGSLRAALEQLSRDLEIAETVRFLGYTDRMLEYYQASDVFVLPSWSEGMSNALLEAMSCGLAPVATAIPGNTDVITHERDGLLVKAGDEHHLAAALKRLLSDSNLRQQIAAAARQTITSRFALEQTAEAYARLYQQLVQQKVAHTAGPTT